MIEQRRPLSGPKDFDSLSRGIDQPTEPDAIVQVFTHFRPEDMKRIRLRSQFGDAIGREWSEFLSFFRRQCAPTFTLDASSVRRSCRAVGQKKQRWEMGWPSVEQAPEFASGLARIGGCGHCRANGNALEARGEHLRQVFSINPPDRKSR